MDRIKGIKALVQSAIKEKVATAVAVSLVKKDGTVFEIAEGKEEEGGKNITTHTLFDLASLTKVVFTTPIVLRFAERGLLSIRDPLNLYLENFPPEITLEVLLTHTSGITAWLPLYKNPPVGVPQHLDKVPRITLSEAVRKIREFGIVRKPFEKVEYSCMNYILLGAVMEKVSGKKLEQIASEFFAEAGMRETMFNPLKGSAKSIAATENIKGLVHDENARALGGVSTNAGLFSSLKDASLFAKMLLSEGTLSGRRILSRHSISLMRSARTGNLSPGRTVGWISGLDFSGAPDFASQNSIGHSGFTGTSIFIDFDADAAIVILTNRVYYGRDNKKHIRLRRTLSNAIYGEFL